MCFGGDSNVPTIPQDPNLGKVQGQASGTIDSLSQYTPQTQGIYYNQANNPYAGGAVQGAQTAGAAGIAQGNQNINTSNQFAGMPQQLQPFIQSALTTGFDPQNALKAQLEQASKDSTNADLAQRGLGNSPWASGVAATADQKFNTNWLDTLLGREAAGAGTAASLMGAGENAAKTGAALGAQGTRQLAEGAALPYEVSSGINRDTASTVPFLTSNQSQMIKDYLSYYSSANQNNSNAVQAGAAQDKADQAFGSGIGGLIGTLFGGPMGASLFGGGGSSMGGADFA